MSDLEQARDYARAMATFVEPPRPPVRHWCRQRPIPEVYVGHPDVLKIWPAGHIEPDHARCFMWSQQAWRNCGCECHDEGRPVPPTDAERALWAQIADEVDAYLAPDDEQETLL